MTVYRATRNEPRVGVGSWTGDFMRGQEYETSDEVPCPRDKVPSYIADYLVSHGILVDARAFDGPADSPAPPVSPQPPKVQPLVNVSHEPRSASDG